MYLRRLGVGQLRGTSKIGSRWRQQRVEVLPTAKDFFSFYQQYRTNCNSTQGQSQQFRQTINQRFIIQMKIESDQKTLSITAEYEKNEKEDCQHAEEAIKDAYQQIESLYITYLKTRGPFVKHISHKKWSALRTLSFQYCGIGDQGCKYLSEESNLMLISQLMLNGNKITSSGIHHLSKAVLPKMNELWLVNNRIGYEGIKFVNKFRCEYLKILYLDGNLLKYQDCLHLFIAHPNFLEIAFIYQNYLSNKDDHLFSLATQKFPYLQQFYTK